MTTRRIMEVADQYTMQELGNAVGKSFSNLWKVMSHSLSVLMYVMIILFCKLYKKIAKFIPVIRDGLVAVGIKLYSVALLIGILLVALWKNVLRDKVNAFMNYMIECGKFMVKYVMMMIARAKKMAKGTKTELVALVGFRESLLLEMKLEEEY